MGISSQASLQGAPDFYLPDISSTRVRNVPNLSRHHLASCSPLCCCLHAGAGQPWPPLKKAGIQNQPGNGVGESVSHSCQTLCHPMDCSPPGSSVHGILQARIPEWVAIPFSRGSSRPRDQTRVSCIAGRFFIVCATKEGGNLYPKMPKPLVVAWVRC